MACALVAGYFGIWKNPARISRGFNAEVIDFSATLAHKRVQVLPHQYSIFSSLRAEPGTYRIPVASGGRRIVRRGTIERIERIARNVFHIPVRIENVHAFRMPVVDVLPRRRKI